MKILIWPHPSLKKVSAQVTKENLPPFSFFVEMTKTMKAAGGVGLSAIQVDAPLRAIIATINNDEMVLLNPRITETFGELSLMQEGCLSTPGQFEEVPRYGRITIDYQEYADVEAGLDARKYFEVHGLSAQIIQHEIEHLDGKMFVDHLKPADKSRILGAMMKLKKSGHK